MSAKRSLKQAEKLEAIRINLRKAVEESGMSQEEIGVLMDNTRESARADISRLLSAKFKRDPQLTTLLALADALKIPLHELLNPNFRPESSEPQS